jgi:hypothetical protein
MIGVGQNDLNTSPTTRYQGKKTCESCGHFWRLSLPPSLTLHNGVYATPSTGIKQGGVTPQIQFPDPETEHSTHGTPSACHQWRSGHLLIVRYSAALSSHAVSRRGMPTERYLLQSACCVTAQQGLATLRRKANRHGRR